MKKNHWIFKTKDKFFFCPKLLLFNNNNLVNETKGYVR